MSHAGLIRVKRRLELTPKNHTYPGVGAWVRNQILIVGDRHTENFNPAFPMAATLPQAPFCTISGSGGWLNEQLDTMNALEDYLYWVNAFTVKGEPVSLIGIIEALNPRYILALGGNALKHVKSQTSRNIQYFHHPQYWKRFRSKEEYPLIVALEYMIRDVRFEQLRDEYR